MSSRTCVWMRSRVSRPGFGQLRKRGNGDGDVVADAAHIEDHLVRMLLDQGPAKQRNHWMSSKHCTWHDGAFSSIEVRNGRAAIRGEEAHHLTRVLRVEAGQKFEITDSQKRLAGRSRDPRARRWCSLQSSRKWNPRLSWQP